MKKIVIFIFLMSGVAFADGTSVNAELAAKKVDFSYWSPWSAYSCDYVRGQAQDVLKQLGATGVNVTCMGGIPYQADVNATFTFSALTPTAQGKVTAQYYTVEVSGHDGCSFNEGLVESILKAFPAKNVRKVSTCWDSQGSYSFRADVLK